MVVKLEEGTCLACGTVTTLMYACFECLGGKCNDCADPEEVSRVCCVECEDDFDDDDWDDEEYEDWEDDLYDDDF